MRTHTDSHHRPVDAAGFPVFCEGELGACHVFVHRCLDRGELDLAAAALERCLRDRPARDAASVHLHWHLVVLDVALGRWSRGFARFVEQVLPLVPRGEARTDGPAGLWHLALAADHPHDLPWDAVAAVALDHLDEPHDFLALHDLLALAGARAVGPLQQWLALRRDYGETPLVGLARGLRACVCGEPDGVELLRRGALGVAGWGGSRAQDDLFDRITSGAATPVLTPRPSCVQQLRPAGPRATDPRSSAAGSTPARAAA